MIVKLVDGIFNSKIRYGLQLYGRARLENSDPTNQDFRSIQLIQNRLLRCLNGTKISDKISTDFLLNKFKTLSVNQQNASIKLLEMWKSTNLEKYPLEVERQVERKEQVSTRANVRGRPCPIGRTCLTQNTCVSDAVRCWNAAPDSIKNCKSLYLAKKEIKTFVKNYQSKSVGSWNPGDDQSCHLIGVQNLFNTMC